MDKDTGRLILQHATAMDPHFQEMFSLIETITDPNLKKTLNEALGTALGNLTVGVVFNIEKIFPDLQVD